MKEQRVSNSIEQLRESQIEIHNDLEERKSINKAKL